LIAREEAKKNVKEYGSKAEYITPVDNPYVIELLERLGFDSIESLLEGDNLFTRRFNDQWKIFGFSLFMVIFWILKH